MTTPERREADPLSRRVFLGGAGAALAGSLAAAVPAVAPPPQSTRRVRIGVVGGGFGAAFLWHLHPNCQVEAVSDLQPGRRRHLQQVYGCAKAYDSLEQLILDPRVEAVAVFTGAPDHARHVIACMERGKHVICAVPACLTLEEAGQLKEVKERTGLTYMMAETSYYRAACMFVRQLWQEDRFGAFLYSETEYYHHNVQKVGAAEALWQGKPTPKGWRWGFPPMFYPTHATAFHVGVTQERFTHVSCLGWGHDDPMLRDNPYDNPYSDQVALLQGNRGNICRCNVLWWIHADGERAQWLGENLSVYMPHSGGQRFAVKARGQGVPTELPTYLTLLPESLRLGTGHGNSHGFLTHEFLAALLAEREPAVDLYEALAMTVPGLVAMESCRKDGERLPIPNFDRG